MKKKPANTRNTIDAHDINMAILLLMNYRDEFHPSSNGYNEINKTIAALQQPTFKAMDSPTVERTFPNGFTNWMETHHEVVSYIASQDLHSKDDTEIIRTNNTGGSTALYTLAEKWTDEFELKNKDRDWDGEFFEEIEQFCNDKNLAP